MIMIGDSQEDCDQLTTTTDSDIIPGNVFFFLSVSTVVSVVIIVLPSLPCAAEFELHVSSLPRGITQVLIVM